MLKLSALNVVICLGRKPSVHYSVCCCSTGAKTWVSWLRRGQMNANSNTATQRLKLLSSDFMKWEEIFGHPKNLLTLAKSSTAGSKTKRTSARKLKTVWWTRFAVLINRSALRESSCVWHRLGHENQEQYEKKICSGSCSVELGFCERADETSECVLAAKDKVCIAVASLIHVSYEYEIRHIWFWFAKCIRSLIFSPILIEIRRHVLDAVNQYS